MWLENKFTLTQFRDSSLVYHPCNDSSTQTQGQCQPSRSWGLPLNFMPFKSPQSFVRFTLIITQMFLSVSWCAEPMTQLCKVKVRLQGHGILWRGIWLSYRLLSCHFYLKFNRTFCKQTVKTMTRRRVSGSVLFAYVPQKGR